MFRLLVWWVAKVQVATVYLVLTILHSKKKLSISVNAMTSRVNGHRFKRDTGENCNISWRKYGKGRINFTKNCIRT